MSPPRLAQPKSLKSSIGTPNADSNAQAEAPVQSLAVAEQTAPIVALEPKISEGKLEIPYRYSISVLVRYSLDLGRDNVIAGQLVKEISRSDGQFRGCYLPELDSDQNLRGQVKLSVEKAKGSVGFSRVGNAGGQIKNSNLIQCLIAEVKRVEFREEFAGRPLKGSITYTFDHFYGSAASGIASND